MSRFSELRPGDFVIRIHAGREPIGMEVIAVDDELIRSGSLFDARVPPHCGRFVWHGQLSMSVDAFIPCSDTVLPG